MSRFQQKPYKRLDSQSRESNIEATFSHYDILKPNDNLLIYTAKLTQQFITFYAVIKHQIPPTNLL